MVFQLVLNSLDLEQRARMFLSESGVNLQKLFPQPLLLLFVLRLFIQMFDFELHFLLKLLLALEHFE